MSSPRRPRTLSLLLAIAAACPALAGEAATDEQYQKELAGLKALTENRDLELFELSCEPLALDRLVVTSKTGETRAFNYLVFRLRNLATDSTKALALKAKGYNEVLQEMAEKYKDTKIDQDGGVKLKVDGVSDPKEAIILERQEGKPKQRTVNLSVVAWDERGSRIGLLDYPAGATPQYTWQFPDLGSESRASTYRHVHDLIEEKLHRKLFSPDQIRATKLEPFDGVKRIETDDIENSKYDTKGWFAGETYGLIIFDKFSERGQKITIELRGLSNKFRVRAPASQAGKVDNYLETRYQRRTFVLTYDWPGDEYFRHEDTFRLLSAGYQWVDTFIRQDVRASIATTKYFFDNITTADGSRQASVEEQLWDQYRATRSGSGKGKDLPDFESQVKDLDQRIQGEKKAQ